MGLCHKNFYGGRARIYKQYVARGNANGIANFVNFQKKFFSLKKMLSSRYGGKARRYFFAQSIQFFLLKSGLHSVRRKYKSLEAKMRGANWLDLLWLAKISTSWQGGVYAAKNPAESMQDSGGRIF